MVNVALGIWLIVSIWVWPHTAAQAINRLVVGILAVIAAGLAALWAPRFRFVNAVLGVYVFATASALPPLSTWSRWNYLFVGALMTACALTPSTRPRSAARSAS
jgi:hypothetical protein